MSGEALAKKVGYKHQSAIGNLENRSNGTGGNKISEIAEALDVPLEWLIRGPDSATVPRAEKAATGAYTIGTPLQRNTAGEDISGYDLHQQAVGLFAKLDVAGKKEAVAYLHYLVSRSTLTLQSDSGESDPLPQPKAA